MLSLVIPVYNNAPSLPSLFAAIEALAVQLPAGGFEVVFVVDGATDASLELLRRRVTGWQVPAQLIELSRNFGSFAAVAAGLSRANGARMAVMAADLQEPPSLIIEFNQVLATGDVDVVLGSRITRDDPWLSHLLSTAFWRFYRRVVNPQMPAGGVDVFGCTRTVRDELMNLKETNTNLIGLLLWVGFRVQLVMYHRQQSTGTGSGWTFGKKVRYALDSVYNFTDVPVRALLIVGGVGTTLAILASISVLIGWSLGQIPVLGYTPLMLATTFFGGLTALGLGIVGQYLWLTLQNARRRPSFIIRSAEANQPPTAPTTHR